MTDQNEAYSIIDVPGYPLLYDSIASFVHGTPRPRLAAGAVLNAVCAVAMTTMGSDALADLLRRTADALPAEEAKARNQLA